MISYADISEVKARYNSPFNEDTCRALLEDAAIIIDAYNTSANLEAKKVVSCRMVIRAMGISDSADVPIGATQATMSALGYSQTWTLSQGATGELYLSKQDKSILGGASKVGAYSPVEDLL